MTNFVIDKGIPLWEDKSNKNKNNKYPFPDMEIGDSFIFSEIYSRELMNRSLSTARTWATYRKNGWKFEARKTDDDKIRIWRVK
jgi:hypothetical protein